MVYHYYIGTKTVIFRPSSRTGFPMEGIKGLKLIFQNRKHPTKDKFLSPYDYTFANLYEITAIPSPVALGKENR